MLLMIDNYDSFTWNLVQYFAELGHETLVRRNDELTIADLIALKPTRLVISPGPCSPNEAGISLAAIRHFAGKIPILGVCLGHQAIAQAFGGQIVRAHQVVHGKNSSIRHQHQSVFASLKDPLSVTRYHSLVVAKASLPADFILTAWTETVEGVVDEIMGIAHRTLPIHGVQFHPEAILTEQGHQLLANFLQIPATSVTAD
jgi:anthranilate synthase/aminodeoxychorismate synthase-like glutamine amidotransferase